MRKLIGAAVLAACASTAHARVERYAGFLPCADCPALRIELALHIDAATAGRYEQRLTYVDTREGDKPVPTAGRWRTLEGSPTGASVIELVAHPSGERQLLRKRGDQELRLLDGERREIDSPLAQVLRRSEPERVGAPVIVSPTASQARVVLNRGQELVVRLPGQPGTGYSWSLRRAATPLLMLVATPSFERDAAALDLPGALSTEVWRLAGLRRGAQTLVFEFRRLWESGVAPAKTISVPVAVH